MNKIFFLCAALLCGAGYSSAQESVSCNYWFVTHGTKNAFWEVVKKGAEDAALSLGCTVQFYFSGGNLQAQQDNFLKMLSSKPDGIALSITNDKLFDAPVARALDSGIAVLAVNNDDSRGAAGNRRLCYVGQDDEAAAYRLGLLLIETAQKKGFDIFKTQTVLFSELPGSNFDSKRVAGLSRALGEFGMKPPKIVDLGQVRGEYERKIEAHLDAGAGGGRLLVVALGAAATEALYSALKSSGRAPGEVLAGGFDLGPHVVEAIKAGYLAATVDQQQYLQGYFSVYSLWLYNRYGFAADIDTGRNLVDNPAELQRLYRLSGSGMR